jgi:hypothetical protein
VARLYRGLAQRLFTALCHNPELQNAASISIPKPPDDWAAVAEAAPPFHLAENKRNQAYPFAFLATYTHRISEQGKAQHQPLGRALEEYAGTKNRAGLAALLSPVQRAAEQSKVARQLLDSRAVFHPQVWRPEQAFSFLQDIPSRVPPHSKPGGMP